MKTLTNLTKMLVVLGVVGLVAGCSSVLPTTTNKSQSSWKDYQHAKGNFDLVKLEQTNAKDLNTLGFGSDQAPNTKVLNYVELVNLFGSAFKLEDLPKGVRACVAAREDCFAYIVAAQNIKAKRNGNVAADLFGFRKHTHTTGWEFKATLVLVKGRVVYKLWSGTPDIETFENTTTPLGPMQNMSGLIKPF